MNRPDRIEQYDKIEKLFDEAAEQIFLMKKDSYNDTEFRLRRVQLAAKEALALIEYLESESHVKAVLK